jgi:hypothetical protein
MTEKKKKKKKERKKKRGEKVKKQKTVDLMGFLDINQCIDLDSLFRKIKTLVFKAQSVISCSRRSL